jgi:hypothetical protein
LIFSNSAFSQNFQDFLYKCYHVPVVVKYVSKIPTVMNSRDVKLEVSVPDSKSWNIPEVVLVRRWAVGVLGIWREGVGWVKGGANGVSLQAT